MAAGHGACAAEPRRTPRRSRRGAGMRDEGFGYETMFLVQAAPGRPLDVDAIRGYYESIGESVLVAGDARAIKVHVHNERPDQVLGLCARPGDAVEDQRREPRPAGERRPRDEGRGVCDRMGHRERDRAGDCWSRPRPRPGRRRRRPSTRAPMPRPSPSSPWRRARASPRSSGTSACSGSSYGGQTANPSTGELLEAVKSVDAHEVLLLPNNPNVVLAARQVAAMCDARSRSWRPATPPRASRRCWRSTRTKGALDNAGEMTIAGRAVQTLSVTAAVRDATIGGRKVKQGQTIALDPDDGLVAVDDDPSTAVLDAIKALSPGVRAASPSTTARAATSPGRRSSPAGSTTWGPARRSRSSTAASRTTAT